MPARALARRKTTSPDTAFDMAGREIKQLLETEAEWNADTFEAIQAIFSSNGVPLDVIPTTYDDEPQGGHRSSARRSLVPWRQLVVYDEADGERLGVQDELEVLRFYKKHGHSGRDRHMIRLARPGHRGPKEMPPSAHDVDWTDFDKSHPKLRGQYGSRVR